MNGILLKGFLRTPRPNPSPSINLGALAMRWRAGVEDVFRTGGGSSLAGGLTGFKKMCPG
jgi:hypothetical protein